MGGSIYPKFVLSFLALSLFSIFLAQAEEPGQGDQSWKERLSDKGIDVSAVLTSEIVGNLSRGGVSRGARALFNVDLVAGLDTEKAQLWKGGRAALYLLGNFGGTPSDLVGDLQTSSNIQAPTSFKVYEAWYEQAFFEKRLTLLAGLHDLNSEFDSLSLAGSLTNSSFGVTPELAQIGPSIFPTTALCLRAKLQPTDTSYFMFAVFDGVSGDPDNTRGTHIMLKRSDGLLYIAEAGLTPAESDAQQYYKIAAGAWRRTTDYVDYQDRWRSDNQGMYLIGERMLFEEEVGSGQGLGAFLQFGFANQSRNELARYHGGGLNYVGLLPGREQDTLALGYARAQHGQTYLDLNEGSERAETTIEISYRAELTSRIALQPDFQYVINPGTDAELNNAKVVGIRLEVAL